MMKTYRMKFIACIVLTFFFVSVIIFYKDSQAYVEKLTIAEKQCKHELKIVSDSLDEETGKKEALEKELKEAERKTASDGVSNKNISQRLKSIMVQYKQCQSQFEHVDNENKKMKKDIQEFEIEINRLKEQEDTAIESIKNLKMTVHSLNAEIEHLEEEKRELKKKLIFKDEHNTAGAEVRSNAHFDNQKEIAPGLYKVNVQGDTNLHKNAPEQSGVYEPPNMKPPMDWERGYGKDIDKKNHYDQYVGPKPALDDETNRKQSNLEEIMSAKDPVNQGQKPDDNEAKEDFANLDN